MDDFNKSFNEANKKVHPVETQWHYPIMVKFGFTAETKEGVGFVRSYVYAHPSGLKIRCNTGCNADYWNDEAKKLGGGYWSDLEPFLVKVLGDPGRIDP